MYVILEEQPYEYSTILGIYDSLDNLKQALIEQDIQYKQDTFYPQYRYTKTEQHEDYTSTTYYSIIKTPLNTFNEYGYDLIEYEV